MRAGQPSLVGTSGGLPVHVELPTLLYTDRLITHAHISTKTLLTLLHFRWGCHVLPIQLKAYPGSNVSPCPTGFSFARDEYRLSSIFPAVHVAL